MSFNNFHMHTTYCDGANTPKEMAEAATKLMEQKGLRPFKLPPHVKAAFESM